MSEFQTASSGLDGWLVTDGGRRVGMICITGIDGHDASVLLTALRSGSVEVEER